MEIDLRTWRVQGTPDGNYVILEHSPVGEEEVLTLIPQSTLIDLSQLVERMIPIVETMAKAPKAKWSAEAKAEALDVLS